MEGRGGGRLRVGSEKAEAMKLVSEDDRSYVLNDGSKDFRVPKAGLSEALSTKIRGYADGGYAMPLGGAGSPPVVYDAQGNPIIPGAGLPDAGIPTQSVVPPQGPFMGTPPLAVPVAPVRETRDPLMAEIRRGDDAARKTTDTATALGVRPRAELPKTQPPEVVAPQPPAPTALPVAKGGAGPSYPGLKEQLGGLEEQKGAAVLSSMAEADKGRQIADALSAQEQQMRANALEDKARIESANARALDLMAQHKAAQDDMRNIDTTVDPGRFWASRSTGGKITGIIGLALGALGTGPDGINKAAQMMERAIDRDLEAQKAEHTIRLQKGKAAIDAAQSAYAMERQRFGDDNAAAAAAKADAYALVQNQLAKIQAGSMGPAAAAAAAELLGVLDVKKGQATEEAAKAAALRAQAYAAAQAAREKGSGGASATEIKDLKAATAATATMEQTIGKLSALISDTNVVTEKVGGRAGVMKGLAADLLLQVKEGAKLGALDRGAIEVAKDLIGDPNATFELDGTKIARLNTLLSQAKSRLANAQAVQQ